MNITTEQRKALEALRGVFLKHDIHVEAGNYDGTCELWIGDDMVGGYNEDIYDITTNILDKLLEQEQSE